MSIRSFLYPLWPFVASSILFGMPTIDEALVYQSIIIIIINWTIFKVPYAWS